MLYHGSVMLVVETLKYWMLKGGSSSMISGSDWEGDKGIWIIWSEGLLWSLKNMRSRKVRKNKNSQHAVSLRMYLKQDQFGVWHWYCTYFWMFSSCVMKVMVFPWISCLLSFHTLSPKNYLRCHLLKRKWKKQSHGRSLLSTSGRRNPLTLWLNKSIMQP